jgi:hypothetical protein
MSRLETPDPDGAPVFYAALFGWTTEASDIGETRITVFHLPGYVGGEPEQASSPPLSMDRTVSRRRPTEAALGRHAAALGQSAGFRPNPGALRLEFGAGRGPARRMAAGCRRHLATATADLEFIPPGRARDHVRAAPVIPVATEPTRPAKGDRHFLRLSDGIRTPRPRRPQPGRHRRPAPDRRWIGLESSQSRPSMRASTR